MFLHGVIRRGVYAHDGDIEEPRRVNRPCVVRRQEPPLDLSYPLFHQVFGYMNGHALLKEYPGLHLHHVIESGHGATFRVVRDDQIYGLSLLREPVGKHDLPYLHIYTEEYALNLLFRIAIKDPGIRVEVGKAFEVEPPLVLLLKFVELLLLTLKALFDLSGPSGVEFHTPLYGFVIYIFYFHNKGIYA